MKKSLLLTALILMLASSSAWGQKSSLQYHGFNVNFAEISKSPRKNAILDSVKEQIEIVERVGPRKEDLDFFRSVRIVIQEDSSGTPGLYKRNKNTVFLKGKDLGSDKPVLLHELMHAYHDQRLPQGIQNEEVNQFYLKALKAFSEFKGKNYFLQNKKEFFATTATIYFLGTLTRPPYNRQSIKEKLPLYYKYLANLFGEKNP